MTNYNELVDYQVQSMGKSDAPFDTEAYANYKEQVKQYQLNTNGNLTEMILRLGFRIDQLLEKIISQLDELKEGNNDAK